MAGTKKNRVAALYCEADDLLKELRAELGVGARVTLTSGDRGNCEITMTSKRGNYSAKSKTFTACLANAVDVVQKAKSNGSSKVRPPKRAAAKRKPAKKAVAKRTTPRRRRVPASK